MKITFLGAGVFGSALANIARDNGYEIKFYDPFKYPDISLHDATNGSDLNIFTAPSSAAKNILPELDKDTPLIIASKGFVSLKPFQNFKDISALGGASFANEIEHTIFTTSSEIAENIFSTENIKLEYTNDTLGIMLCGSLKNIYALGAGLYGETDSTAAPMSYLETAIAEMKQILELNHANPDTLRLSCGAADLVLSCTEKGRNFRFGRELKTTISENSTSQDTTPKTETIESIAIISSLNDYPEFIIPESTNLINDIINTIKDHYATK
jgi:glycerol-3-phosphate dehydrogenase (NAD(P)+)